MSLFGSDSESDSDESACSIPGLFYYPKLIPPELQSSLALALSSYFTSNQIMLFTSPSTPFPPFLQNLIEFLSSTLTSKPSIAMPVIPAIDPLPVNIHELLFSPKGGNHQAIFNLYRPNEGISPHVDLLARYGDGIIGVSLLSSVKMDFTRGSNEKQEKKSLLLRPGDVIILSKEARYDWNHGIAPRGEDHYIDENGEDQKLIRGLRMSITIRRMLKDAHIVGGEAGCREQLI